VRIDTFFSLYGPGVIVAIIGAIFLGIGRWFRKRRGGGAARERAAEVTAKPMPRDPWSSTQHGPESESRTTDPSKPGHAHKPKPKQTPTVRRMR
jgi:hypothetical protein